MEWTDGKSKTFTDILRKINQKTLRTRDTPSVAQIPHVAHKHIAKL